MLVINEKQKCDRIYFKDTSLEDACHKLLAEHSILSSTFILLTNFWDILLLDQVSFFSYRKNAESLGFAILG